jgi:hypothetical protein
MSGIEKWQALFDKLTVEGYSFAVTNEQLDSFEDLLGFRLPKEFRDFYKIFGLGIFGGDDPFICFEHVLPIPDLWLDNIEHERHIRQCQFSYSWLETSTDFDYASLEEHSYIFAHADSVINCLWDLRTWDPKKESYLMYFFVGERGFLKEIGYSFYDFVMRYCIEKYLMEDMVRWGCYSEGPVSDSQDGDSEQYDDEYDEPKNIWSAPNHFFRSDETIDEFRDHNCFPKESS